MAATAVTTSMAGAINYTYVTDTSADWASVPNNTYFYDKADKLVHYKNSGGTVLEIFGVSGLTYFTEAQSTAAPNATVNVDSLTAVASTANADIALVPKGTGALLADIPDNTATGGNKRGQYAVDWQMVRTNNVCVASGDYSSIVGGQNCIASGSHSVAGGASCNASGTGSIAFGSINTSSNRGTLAVGEISNATGYASFASGYSNTASSSGSQAQGYFNIASGGQSIALGQSNTASAQTAIAIGESNISNAAYGFAYGRSANTFSIIGRKVYASGQESTSGDAQVSTFVLHERTTGNTATTLTTDSGVASTTNQVILSNNAAYAFEGKIIGKQSGSTNAAVWKVEGLIVRGANAASTVLTASTVTLFSNLPGWGTPTLAADTTNGGLQVQVAGLAATNIQWTAVIETTEVIYA